MQAKISNNPNAINFISILTFPPLYSLVDERYHIQADDHIFFLYVFKIMI